MVNITTKIQLFSKKYTVRVLEKSDISKVLALCEGNELYYEYCPLFSIRENVFEDINALSPKKTPEDRFYVGFLMLFLLRPKAIRRHSVFGSKRFFKNRRSTRHHAILAERKF